MSHYGIGLVIFPTSWRAGVVRSKPGKWVFAFGPFRITAHKVEAQP